MELEEVVTKTKDPSIFEGMKVSPRGEFTSRVAFPSADMEVVKATLPEGWHFRPGLYDALTQMEQDGEVVARPLLVPEPVINARANGKTCLSIQFPEGENNVMQITQVTENDRTRERRIGIDVSDGFLEFDTTIPGTYVFDIEPEFPYQKQRVIINAEN